MHIKFTLTFCLGSWLLFLKIMPELVVGFVLTPTGLDALKFVYHMLKLHCEFVCFSFCLVCFILIITIFGINQQFFPRCFNEVCFIAAAGILLFGHFLVPLCRCVWFVSFVYIVVLYIYIEHWLLQVSHKIKVFLPGPKY